MADDDHINALLRKYQGAPKDMALALAGNKTVAEPGAPATGHLWSEYWKEVGRWLPWLGLTIPPAMRLNSLMRDPGITGGQPNLPSHPALEYDFDLNAPSYRNSSTGMTLDQRYPDAIQWAKRPIPDPYKNPSWLYQNMNDINPATRDQWLYERALEQQLSKPKIAPEND